jgi:NAD-dependent SIR2 family protein deacetylase
MAQNIELSSSLERHKQEIEQKNVLLVKVSTSLAVQPVNSVRVQARNVIENLQQDLELMRAQAEVNSSIAVAVRLHCAFAGN